PLFCRGIGPFRWAARSGDPADIATIDVMLRELFPDDPLLQRWLELAPERVAFQGLPARICWLGYGDRAKAGLAMNELVRSGAVKAPIAIGRDHLDAGSVASPYRETEAMRDGSDAIADWPILNALVNVAAGATWVSVHHGGGVGIGNSIHAGLVVVRDRAQLATPAEREAPLRGAALGEIELLEDAYVLCSGDMIEAVGRMRDLPSVAGEVVEVDGRGLCAVPGLVDCHTHAAFGGDRVEEFSLRAGGASYEELHARGGGILSTVRATREAGVDGLRAAVERHRGWMRGQGTTTFEAKSGYGLDRETELASLRAIRDAGGVPTWLGAHAVPPEFGDADAYLDFALAEVLPDAARLATSADGFLERNAFD